MASYLSDHEEKTSQPHSSANVDLELLDLKGYHHGLANNHCCDASSLIKTTTDQVYKLSLRKLRDG